MRRVEADALAAMAAGLELTAQVLEGDKALTDRAIGSQRELRDYLSELAQMREASQRIARSLDVLGRMRPSTRRPILS